MLDYKNKNRTSIRSAEGFTLLELLVALTIGTVLIVASGAVFKSSVGLMRRGERWLQTESRETSALEFWREQVSALRTDDSASALFLGKKGELNFVTPVRLNLRYKGLVVAQYSIREEKADKYSLIYKENVFTTAQTTQKKEEEDSEALVLLQNYDGIRFEYLGKAAKNKNQWKSKWAEGQGIPRALRLVLMQGKERQALIAPIVAISFSSSSGP
ncbi:MAG: prepilin-type N-terminal cleavage/methylation domain-containing protein [Planctomycetota bacterium]